jgi:serine/threonine protein kinase
MFPWADGGNLRNYWEKRGGEPQERSSLQWILGQFVGISSALEVLHENESNCRHADLKPENILWFKDEVDEGTLRIVDLGLAASHEEEAHTKQRLGMPTKMLSGTSRYEPPETDQDWGNDKPRSRQYDIWSMGCIMLELLIYLIYGYNAIGTFQDKTEHFWCKSSKSERSVYYVHPYVDSCMRIMDVQLQGGTAYKDLLHLVQTRLLIVDFQGYRETARGLHMKIYDIYSRCQSEPLYLTPIRLEYPSSRIESWNIFGESTSKVVESQSSTEEYPRRDTGPSHLSCDEMEKLETWIVQVLTDDKIVSRRVGEQGNPASGSKVTVKVNIDMREFLEWIRSDYRGVSPLEVVTVTGTPTTAVAHKAGWYLDWRWPQSGRALLDGLAGLIEGNIYGE